jgi:hypothetical protein
VEWLRLRCVLCETLSHQETTARIRPLARMKGDVLYRADPNRLGLPRWQYSSGLLRSD